MALVSLDALNPPEKLEATRAMPRTGSLWLVDKHNSLDHILRSTTPEYMYQHAYAFPYTCLLVEHPNCVLGFKG